jgi:MOSC domain-containing protein YiiM
MSGSSDMGFQRTTMSTILAVSLSPHHGFSKTPQPAIHLLAGQGVQGDAHCGSTVQHVYLKRRNPDAPNRMQVHLLQSELFAELTQEGRTLNPGELGENITTHGIDLLTLPLGTRLHLGPHAVIELTGLRTPCKQIDAFQPGLLRAVINKAAPPKRRGRAGVMAVVIRGGTVTPGDIIQTFLPQPPLRPLSDI